MADSGQAAATIEKQSQGLLHFVDAYRNLAALPKADLQVIRARELFERVGHLMKADFPAPGRRLRGEFGSEKPPNPRRFRTR
jgi:hypothetical protein